MKNEAINELCNYWLIPEGRVSRVVSREVEKMEQHIADLEAQLSKARRKNEEIDTNWLELCQLIGLLEDFMEGDDTWENADLEDFLEFDPWATLRESLNWMKNSQNCNDILLAGGAGMISAERQRQIKEEGWSANHDDKWAHGEMWIAASCYLALDDHQKAPELWPWSANWWKPKDRIRNLTRAGALIAAEIDRLKRKQTAIDGGALEDK